MAINVATIQCDPKFVADLSKTVSPIGIHPRNFDHIGDFNLESEPNKNPSLIVVDPCPKDGTKADPLDNLIIGKKDRGLILYNPKYRHFLRPRWLHCGVYNYFELETLLLNMLLIISNDDVTKHELIQRFQRYEREHPGANPIGIERWSKEQIPTLLKKLQSRQIEGPALLPQLNKG